MPKSERGMTKIRGIDHLSPRRGFWQAIDIPEFIASIWARGGDLQTLYNRFSKTTDFVTSELTETLLLPLDDTGDDRLVAFVDRPEEGEAWRIKPAIMLLHGLGGKADSVYMRQSADMLTQNGFEVIRVNLRGAGPSVKTSRGFYNAGRSDDIRALVKALPALIKDIETRGLVMMGYSLGGNQLLKYLGEGDVPIWLRLALAVSPPLDLAASAQTLLKGRNYFYQRYLIRQLNVMLDDALRCNPLEALLALPDRTFNSIYEFDEKIIAPLNGYQGADDYYAQCSSKQFVPHIKTPTVIIHAASDPWIPAETFRSMNDQLSDDTLIIVTKDGGHVGFHARFWRETWYDYFLKGLLND